MSAKPTMRSKESNLLIATATAVCVGIGGGLLLPHHRAAGASSPAASVAAAPSAANTSARTTLNAARTVLAGVGIESSAGSESSAGTVRAQSALAVLGKAVREQSDPDALRLAFQAYYNYESAHPEKVRKPYLYYVDYGLGSGTPRGYVFDMEALKVVDGPFMVAHGRGSAPTRDGVPTRFSNRQGSASTSLGLFLAQETYAFTGHTGGSTYHSVGLRLTGLSSRFNSAARARGVVVHGAPYVTATRAGRSEGCPAMEPARARELLPKIGNGGLVFLFSPRDKSWKSQDPWATGSALLSGSHG